MDIGAIASKLEELRRINPNEFKARAEKAHPLATELVEWLISRGLDPKAGTDLLLYTIGYVGKIKGFELDVVDYLGMYAAGRVDAELDQISFNRES